MEWFGISEWGWVAAAGGVAVFVAALLLIWKRRGRRAASRAVAESDSRLEILETTIVDETRRLLLVRCDGIEHLIMTGGPTDVVVENDVKKARAPVVAAAAKPAAAKQLPPEPTAEPRINGAARKEAPKLDAEPKLAPPVAAKPAEGKQPRAPEPEVQAALRPALNTVQPAAAARRGGQAAPHATPTTRRPEHQIPRREPVVPAGKVQPAPVAANQPEEPLRMPARAARDKAAAAAKPAGLPAAEVPWTEADSIENEIVRALRVEPHPPLAASASAATPRQDAAAGRTATSDPSTTLGDLADRLEEALAREVQTAHQGRGRLELGLDAFVAEPERAAKPAASAKERARPEARATPAAATAVERQEEAPVINLNARRREAVDPLEDEMARLLGELTGDTGRR